MIRVSLFVCVFLQSCVLAIGGVASDRLQSISRDAVRLEISGPIRDGRRPLVRRTFDSKEISRFLALFDLVDPDVSDVPDDEFIHTTCLCVYSYIVEIDLADGSRLTIGVVGEFSIIDPSVSLHPKHLGTLSLTPESSKIVAREVEKQSRRTRRYRQPR